MLIAVLMSASSDNPRRAQLNHIPTCASPSNVPQREQALARMLRTCMGRAFQRCFPYWSQYCEMDALLLIPMACVSRKVGLEGLDQRLFWVKSGGGGVGLMS